MADTPSNPLFPGKQFISTVLEALETKTRMTGTIAHRYLMRAAMAGMIVAVFYVVNYAIVGTFDELSVGGASLAGVGRVLGALCFGPALVFIYYTRSELLTSNMMVVVIGGYYRRISWWRGLRVLGMCLLGNFLGGLGFALLYRFSSLLGGSTGDQAVHSVETKLAYLSSASGIGDLLVRAILCNFMINLAMLLIYNGFIHEDWSKIFSMIMAVFVFAFLGLEHSVANTVLFTVVGMTHGIEVPLAMGNVAVALLGNFVGGGLLIGAYYAYANDDSRWLRRHAASQPAAQAEGSQKPKATRS
ncbi:formate/nitrite transporter family protein [Actinomyces sp. 2119]|uniref:Formate/nitrite transporter family protein n=1 Tax=Actinomyces lilanjuaniae TaxID=2321394 RepID=A0ABN5PR05_9ACTO|nr:MULTISPECIES: formate/nitrite transporter family protein [Actinomyces]AYD90820.1 formate/nitrite transporter family protein [Actinomyces lilanjuaniae]RJF40243.1 formate/nitrite transporter family protein [Actinomyces sp. 2119]